MNEALNRSARKLASLRSLSARLGKDLSLVQAASGNTSQKLDGSIWIKASGKWLADAQTENIFVPVALDGSQRHLGSGFDGLRPSIETAMHLALPDSVVVHVHSVAATAWAVRKDAPEHLATRLRGLRWRFIPYVPSGEPLARHVALAVQSSPEPPQVFVLGNHGLVVCGKCCKSVARLLQEVEERISIEPRRSRTSHGAHIRALTDGEHWRMPPDEGLHALAFEPNALRILAGGVLYPCQAIFLAPSRHLLSRTASLSDAALAYESAYGVRAPFFIVEGQGVVLKPQITCAEYAMLLGLLQVVQRLDEPEQVQYLTDLDVNRLLEADAYSYRALVESSARADRAGLPDKGQMRSGHRRPLRTWWNRRDMHSASAHG